MSLVFVDTNVLLYMVDHDAAAKRDAARVLVLDSLGRKSLALSTQVLQEFFWNATRKLNVPLPPKAALGLSRDLCNGHVVRPSPAMVVAAMERCGHGSLSIWDALILEAAESCGAEVLYSEDKHLLAADTEIEVVDPFASLSERDTD